MGSNLYMDGGTVWNTNLITAADRCREIVDDDSKIIMDIILSHENELHPESKTGDAIDNYFRSREISGYYKKMNDIVEFK